MRRSLVVLVSSLGVAACGSPASAPPAPAEAAIVFEGARLIADAGAPPIESSAFVVTGEAITAG